MINVALIGMGYWGEKYVSTLLNMEDVYLSWIGVKNKKLRFSLGPTKITTNLDKILNDKDVECVIIATPAKTHFPIAKKCIESGKHCLIEKPFTWNSDEAKELVELNKDKNLVIMPGHLYLYHPGIQKLRDLIDFDEGKVFAKRMSKYKYHDSLAEMATHDIYILRYLFGNEIEVKSLMGNTLHAISNINFGKMECFIESSTDYPGKIREMVFKKHRSYKVVIFDESKHAIQIYHGDKLSTEYYNEAISPLTYQCKHFFECVEGKDTPNVDVQDGLQSILILEKLYNEIN